MIELPLVRKHSLVRGRADGSSTADVDAASFNPTRSTAWVVAATGGPGRPSPHLSSSTARSSAVEGGSGPRPSTPPGPVAEGLGFGLSTPKASKRVVAADDPDFGTPWVHWTPSSPPPRLTGGGGLERPGPSSSRTLPDPPAAARTQRPAQLQAGHVWTAFVREDEGFRFVAAAAWMTLVGVAYFTTVSLSVYARWPADGRSSWRPEASGGGWAGGGDDRGGRGRCRPGCRWL